MTNYLKGKRMYLSGPIEFDSEKTNWREEPTQRLQEMGVRVFDPYADPKQQKWQQLQTAREAKDFKTMRRVAKQFVRKDLNIVDRADFVVAYLPYKVPTTGTHHEIINSCNAKKPTLLVCPQGKEMVPIWYYGFVRPRYMFGSWNDLFAYLTAVDSGDHKKDWRWAFVYGRL